ncbi:hypothetical protein NQ314_016911 [Rhamnusium bicolor]|uniref:Uncharacterized protein n=1 Tax=Rhamnusium bicolor TaxID=1586634 RepID=A0AAV8WVM5_9CUCU|nr:hypothetical protein NQ314_016911 [Rhamnusium bicolor]
MERGTSPFKAEVPFVISFLQSILDSGQHVYGSLNSHRSALSLILPGIIGEDQLVKQFMKGVCRLRPPKPRYNFTWDPSLILDYLDKTPTNSLKAISRKLITLLVLTTGQRLQTISIIQTTNIKRSNTGLQIFIADFLKTSGVNRPQPCLEVPFYLDNPNLCVANTLICTWIG